MIMEEILTNPMWQVLAVILSTFAILISIILFLFGRKRKSLSYEIISNNPVILKKDAIKEKLEIFFNKKIVKNVYLIVLKFINSGNVPIEVKDYDEPLSISFGEGAKVLTAEISEGISTHSTIGGGKIILKPTLLNKEDYMKIQILVSKYSGGKITFGGRIVGVKSIKKMTESKIYFITVLSGMIIAMIGMMWSMREPKLAAFPMSLFFIGYVLILIGIFINKRMRERLFRAIRK